MPSYPCGVLHSDTLALKRLLIEYYEDLKARTEQHYYEYRALHLRTSLKYRARESGSSPGIMPSTPAGARTPSSACASAVDT